MHFVGVIPARYESSRLPGKALIDLAGKPMIQWVYERCLQASVLREVWVATDDERIMAAVERFGGRAMMTDSAHHSGTDRVAEVARRLAGDVFVNIQGDEPLISPATVDAVCRPFQEDPTVRAATARVALGSRLEAESPHVVKVVTDRFGRALYFSRAAIPFPRDGSGHFFKHIGIYGYRREFLLELDRLQPSPLEGSERLEQLRFLENGVPVQVVTVQEDSLGVDTPQDVDRVRPILQNMETRSCTPLEDRNQGGRV